jgi:abortive infection bacteriophage resistance protein
MVVGKLHVIREKTKINCKTDIAKVYGIPLSNLLSYLKNINSIEQQALQGCNILKHMRIQRAKHGNMEN